MAVDLEAAMSESHWINWCRLCAKDDVRGNVKIYTSPNETTWNNVVIMAIRKYFDVHMQLENELGGVLCKECYTLISELIDFAEHVTKVQAIFEVLRHSEPNKHLDIDSLRQQYGLRESDWTHIIKPEFESNVIKQISNEEKPISSDIPKQEFIDIGVSLECKQTKTTQSAVEMTVNHLPIEEVLVTDWTAEVDAGDNPIKPRARRKTTRYNVDHPAKATKKQSLKCKVETEIEKRKEEKIQSVQKDEGLHFRAEASCPAIDSVETTHSTEDCIKMASESIDIPSKRQNMKCSWCGKVYHNPASYQKHIRVACRKIEQRTKMDKNTFCELCNKTLSSAAALRLHKEGMHENAKPYVCDHCGKQLKTITALNEHKLVHTDDRPYSCSICKAGFKNRARLKVHKQIHEAPSYVCNICGKKLQTRRTWNMHKLVHSEERKFKCDVCGALFKRSKTLKTHLLSHTGLRPYVCNYCGQTFACNANCRAHKLKKHSQQLKKEEGEAHSSRLSVPTLEELRIMSQKIPKMEVEIPN